MRWISWLSIALLATPAVAQPATVAVAFDRSSIRPILAEGLADKASRRQATADSPVRIASVSKLITALGLMRLADAKVLDLDRDVSDYLGWRLRNPTFPDTPITEGTMSYSADYPLKGKRLYSGGGGLVSTAADYARFCQMMLDNGKAGRTRLLSRKSVELMTHDQLGKIGPDQGFGLGFGVDGIKEPLSELGSPGTYNWGGFFYTGFIVDPKEQMVVIFMAQLHPTGDLNLARMFHTLAYQAVVD